MLREKFAAVDSKLGSSISAGGFPAPVKSPVPGHGNLYYHFKDFEGFVIGKSDRVQAAVVALRSGLF